MHLIGLFKGKYGRGLRGPFQPISCWSRMAAVDLLCMLMFRPVLTGQTSRSPFTSFNPGLVWSDSSDSPLFPTLRYFSCWFTLQLNYFCSHWSQMFTVYCGWLCLSLFLFLSPPHRLAVSCRCFFPFNQGSPHLFLLLLLLPSSSAQSGCCVSSDASGGGQPFVSVAGGNLQTALCQEGHRTRQPHLQILRPSGHCTGPRHTGQSPGTDPKSMNTREVHCVY